MSDPTGAAVTTLPKRRGGVIRHGDLINRVGEDGCTLYYPPRSQPPTQPPIELHFDSSPEALRRFLDAMRSGKEQR